MYSSLSFFGWIPSRDLFLCFLHEVINVRSSTHALSAIRQSNRGGSRKRAKWVAEIILRNKSNARTMPSSNYIETIETNKHRKSTLMKWTQQSSCLFVKWIAFWLAVTNIFTTHFNSICDCLKQKSIAQAFPNDRCLCNNNKLNMKTGTSDRSEQVPY